MKYNRTLYVLISAVTILFLGLLLVLGHQYDLVAQSAQAQINNAWEMAKLSGSYQFNSQVEQIVLPDAHTAKNGQTATRSHLSISGYTNESQQTNEIVISNPDTNTTLSRARSVRGRTFVLQPDQRWQETSNPATMQINTLSLLAGMRDAVYHADDNSYTFRFDGVAYAQQTQRLLAADIAHGVSVNDKLREASQSEQFNKASGNGKITLNDDLLPDTITLRIQMPRTARTNATELVYTTSYFEYARSGIAIRAMIANPLYQLSRWLGGNVTVWRYGILAVIALMSISVLTYIAYQWRQRINLPLSLVLIVMTLYSPFNTLPRAQAATATDPTPVPANTTDSKTPPKPFNPLVSPLLQHMAVDIITTPSSTTQSPSDTTVATLSNRSEQLGAPCANGHNTNGTNPNEDTDCDGLTNTQEQQLYHTAKDKLDSDADGLSDYLEIKVIGTNANQADSDNDGLRDYLEIMVPERINGTDYYTDPFKSDTNDDGISDFFECPSTDTQKKCLDTNTDGVPDFLSNDNDGDKVPDHVDLEPFRGVTIRGVTKTYGEANPYPIRLANVSTNTITPITVDMQIRPSDANLLNAPGAVLDWPSGDTKGQIQRTYDTTFSNPKNGEPSGDSNAANGDIQVSASIELRIPVTATDCGNLPIKSGQTCGANTGDKTIGWLDTELLQKNGIIANWGTKPDRTNTKDEIWLTIPLQAETDASGSTVAYRATVAYTTARNSQWLNAHNARLQWTIMGLQDFCPSDSTTDWKWNGTQCVADGKPPKDRTESVGLLHTYYSNFEVTGINATHHLGTNVAIIAEDVAQTAITDTDKRRLAMTKANNALQMYFIERNTLTIDKIRSTFDNRYNISDPYINTLGVDKTALRVVLDSYSREIDSALLYRDKIPGILDNLVCRITTSTENCATQPITSNPPVTADQLRQQCVANEKDGKGTDLSRCRPMISVVSESTTIFGSFDTSTETITFNTEKTRSRSINSSIYKLGTTRSATSSPAWERLSQSDIEAEYIKINATLKPTDYTPIPTGNNPITWRNSAITWRNSAESFTAALFLRQFQPSHTQLADNAPIEDKPATPASTLNWGKWLNVILTNSYQRIDKILDETKTVNPALTMPTIARKTSTTCAELTEDCTDTSLAVSGSVTGILGVLAGIALLYGESYGAGKVTGGGVIAAAVILAIAIPLLLKYTDVETTLKVIEYAKYSAQLVAGISKIITALVNEFNALMDSISAGLNMVTTPLKTATTVSKLSATLFVFQLLVIASISIWQMVVARHAYERGNIAASMVGQLIAASLLFALGLLAPVGTIIAGIIAAIDAIAGIACATLSAKDRRKTAAQWLCGGISGLIANFFTVYNSNPLVGIKDPLSHTQQFKSDTVLNAPSIGYRQNNSLAVSLTATDYIEKMPAPGSMAFLFGLGYLKWNGEEQSQFYYGLDTNPKTEASLSTPFKNISSNQNGEDYSWKTEGIILKKSLPLTKSGINQALPDVHLSQSSTVPSVSCAGFWIWVFFVPVPIYYCWRESVSDKEAPVDISKGSFIYDIFPASMSAFMSMQGDTANGFTFAWSQDSNPRFPTLADADNDGLTRAEENTNQTRDNTVDSDGDGINDKREVMEYHTLPNDNDSDNDGLTDMQELQYRTNPNQSDSDGDGLRDGEEVVRIIGTGNSATREGGWDVAYKTDAGVIQSYWVNSDPNQADADGDGISDAREKVLGWSPWAYNNGDVVSASGRIAEARIPMMRVDFERKTTTGFATDGYLNASLTGGAAQTDTRNNTQTAVGVGVYTSDIPISLSNQYTLAMWVKPSGATERIFNVAGQLALTIEANKLVVTYTTDNSNNKNELKTEITISPNTWSHIAVAIDRQNIVVYLNGKELVRAASNGNVSDYDTTNNTLTIGLIQTTRFDNVALFAVALDAKAIAQLANDNYTSAYDNNDGVVRPGDKVVVTTNLTNNLLAREINGIVTIAPQAQAYQPTSPPERGIVLKADSTATQQAIIQVPGFNPAVAVDNTIYKDKDHCVSDDNLLCMPLNEAGGTASFRDLSNNHYDIASSPSSPRRENNKWLFDGGKLVLDQHISNGISQRDFTVALWVTLKPHTTPRPLLVTDTSDTTTQKLLIEITSDDKLSVDLGNGALTSKTPISLNTRTHLLVRYMGGLRSLYINGEVVAADPAAITTQPTVAAKSFGEIIVGKEGQQFANAYIDDVQIYARGLREEEIARVKDNSAVSTTPASDRKNDTIAVTTATHASITNPNAISSTSSCPSDLLAFFPFTNTTKSLCNPSNYTDSTVTTSALGANFSRTSSISGSNPNYATTINANKPVTIMTWYRGKDVKYNCGDYDKPGICAMGIESRHPLWNLVGVYKNHPYIGDPATFNPCSQTQTTNCQMNSVNNPPNYCYESSCYDSVTGKNKKDTTGKDTTGLTRNKWYHLAYVYDGNQWSIYVDGIPVFKGIVPITSPQRLSDSAMFFGIGWPTNDMYIGNTPLTYCNLSNINGAKFCTSTGTFWPTIPHALNNYQLFTRELSQTEITNVVQAQSYKLVAPFDEPTSANVFNASPLNTLALTCRTSCPLSGVPGRINTAVRFDGNAQLTLANVDLATEQYGIQFWVKPSHYNATILGAKNLLVAIDERGKLVFQHKTLTPKGDDGTDIDCVFSCEFNTWDNTYVSADPLPLNTWSHVTLYVDQNKNSTGGNETVIINNTPTPASRIITAHDATPYMEWTNLNNIQELQIGNGLRADLDELRIWTNRSHSVAELKAEAARAPLWRLDFAQTQGADFLPEASGLRSDAERSALRASCSSHATWATDATCPAQGKQGYLGDTVTFNGTKDILAIDNINSKVLADSIKNAATIQLLIQPTDLASTTTTTQTLLAYGSNKLVVKIVNKKINVTIGGVTHVATKPLIANGWNSVAFQYDSTGFRYFANGIEDTEIKDTTSHSFVSGNERLRIGGQVSNGIVGGASNVSEAFKGSIDDIAITGAVLDNATIEAIGVAQNMMTASKTTIGTFTVDADNPTASILTQRDYISKDGMAFTVSAKDPASELIDASISYRKYTNAIGIPITEITCNDVANADRKTAVYCPFFPHSQDEGEYRIRSVHHDAVGNQGVQQKTVYVDKTPPTIDMINPAATTCPSTMAAPPTFNTQLNAGNTMRTLTLRFCVTDPNISNTSGVVAGSGVKSLTVSAKDSSGVFVAENNIVTIKNGAYWQATINLPFANPNGTYTIQATATDNVGNSYTNNAITPRSMQRVATDKIEVDSAAPHDLITYPPVQSIRPLIIGGTNDTLQGRVSDFYDARPALQKSLRVRLDFDAADNAVVFDNRADERFISDCTKCPIIARDSVDANRRVGRFNINGSQQFITIHDTASVLTATFSLALQVKIIGAGTIISDGYAANPHLRISAVRAGSANAFKIAVIYNNVYLLSTKTVAAGSWYNLLLTVTPESMNLIYGENWSTTSPDTASLASAKKIPSNSEILIGAIHSDAANTLNEDYFTGYLDNLIITHVILTPADLQGDDVAQGSGVKNHQTRLTVENDGITADDTLARHARYFNPINQSSYPIYDAMNALSSGACVDRTITCPTIDLAGFTTNALNFTRASDGLALGYRLSTVVSDTRTVAVRMGITSNTRSGNIFSLQNTTTLTSSLRLTAQYDQTTQSLTTVIRDGSATPITTTTILSDANWHSLLIRSSQGISDTTVLSLAIDGQETLANTTLQGRWQDAALIVGATSTRPAAVGAKIDDIVVFDTLLSPADGLNYHYGDSMVFANGFDQATLVNNMTDVDESPYQHSGTYLSNTGVLTTTAGVVGNRALVTDGQQQIDYRDNAGVTIAAANQPWALSLWAQSTATNGTLVRGSTADGYGYHLALTGGSLAFTMAGSTITSTAIISSTKHIVVSSDGATMRMLVNGTLVGSQAIDTTQAAPTMRHNKAITGVASQSSTQVGYAAARANNDNRNTQDYSLTQAEKEPWWQVDLGSSMPIDQVIVQSACVTCATPLQQLHVLVFNQLPSDNTLRNGIISATWSYTSTTIIDNQLRVSLPNRLQGRYVRIQLEGNSTALGLAEVAVLRVPHIVIAKDFTGMIDDMRIYRHALSNDEISHLNVMGWKTSGLSTTLNNQAVYDGAVWSRPLPSNLEITAGIQSSTTDKNGNTRISQGEHSLWSGRIDTQTPRVIAQTTPISGTQLATYTVNVTDRNLDINNIQTPCGRRLNGNITPPSSLWYYAHNRLFDGSLIEYTQYQGSCTLSNTPELLKHNTQIMSDTNALTFGERYAYVGGVNQINIIDTQSDSTLVRATAAVYGTVQQLTINRDRTRLYAVSMLTSPERRAIVTVYDIHRSEALLTQRGSVTLPLKNGDLIADVALTNDSSGGYLLLLTTSFPQEIISVNVGNRDQPTQTASMLSQFSSPGKIFAIAASYDIVAMAGGDQGVLLYSISANGRLTFLRPYPTSGYIHNLFIPDKELLLIDDDEPFSNNEPPTSANTLRAIPLISSVINNTATLTTTFEERTRYVLTTAIVDASADGNANNDFYDINAYHINDIVPASTGDLFVLGRNDTDPLLNRVVLVDLRTPTPFVRSSTLLNQPRVDRIISAQNNLIALSHSANKAILHGYQINDARYATRVCDRIGNCPASVADSGASLFSQFTRSRSVSDRVEIITNAAVYTTTTPLITVQANAANGIDNVTLAVDGVNVSKKWDPADKSITAVEVEFPQTLSAGTHTIQAKLQATGADPADIQTTPVYTFTVDLRAPRVQITAENSVVGMNKMVDGFAAINMDVDDDGTITEIRAYDETSQRELAISSQIEPHVSHITVFAPSQIATNNQMNIRIVATDRAGNQTTSIKPVTIDNEPPILTNGQLTAKVGTQLIPIKEATTVTRTNALELYANWSDISDLAKPITLQQLEYTVYTTDATTTYSNTVAAGALRTTALTTSEGSRITTGVRLRDRIGNEGVHALASVYVDTPLTPDYTIISDDSGSVYRGWINSACTLLGSDTRSASNGTQSFATTWDSKALRFNWQGTDWNNEGDLFVYIDSVAGGTMQSYRPNKYTQSITNSVTLGDAFVTLPSNMAGRSMGADNTTIQGADYVVYVNDTSTIRLLRWDSTQNDWIATTTPPEYLYENNAAIENTDIRVLFTHINYAVGQPLGVIAFASNENRLLPWATFPINNPTAATRAVNSLTMTALQNGYSWTNAGSGICPRTALQSKESTQIVASLRSQPNGIAQTSVSAVLDHTNPDAITAARNQTATLCTQLATDPWCRTVAQLQNTNDASNLLVDDYLNQLTNTTPKLAVVGNNSVVSFTLQLQNPTTRPTNVLWARVNTLGSIWLTDANNATIVGGGINSYHNVSNPALRDYQILRIESIAPNSSRTIVLNGKIDVSKAQASAELRIKTPEIAKIEVRISDAGNANAISTRTVEWLNAAIKVDAQAPRLITPTNQQSIAIGTTQIISGTLVDESAVPNVTLEYYSDNTNRVSVNCGAALNSAWRCPITVPTSANTLYFRVRAMDSNAQISRWSGWYTSVVDRDAPIIAPSPPTESVLSKSYVGGDTISLSGLMSDTTSLARLVICDEQQSTCTTLDDTTSSATTQTNIFTNTTSMNITAQPCSATAIDNYTAYPINVTGNSPTRIRSVQLNATIAHPAAQELDLYLQSPAGTRVALLRTIRAATTNLRVAFDDSATQLTSTISGTMSLSGAFTAIRPDNSLATFANESRNGTWQLLACDRTTNSANGVINSASIRIISDVAAKSQATQWSYTLQDTANQDGIVRKLQFWGTDDNRNVSTARAVQMRIDTVAPLLTIAQNQTILLPSTQSIPFQGTASDGGTIQTFRAIIRSGTTIIRSVDITPIVTTSSEQLRINQITNRTQQSYRWEMVIDSTTFAAGSYTTEFIIQDGADNQRTNGLYTFVIPTKFAPDISNIQFTGSSNANAQTMRYTAQTGFDAGTINTSIELDSTATSPYTDTLVRAWDETGAPDSVLQSRIPASIQTATITKIDMNNDFAAMLDQQGKLVTWPVDNSTDHALTANGIAGTTPITDVLQFSIAEQLESDNYLIALMRNGTIQQFKRKAGQSAVTKSTVTVAGANNTTNKVIAVDAGYKHNIALLRSGKAVVWWQDPCTGSTSYCNAVSTVPTPATFGVVQVQAGIDFSVALKDNGTVVAWGDSSYNHLAIPSTIGRVTQLAVGSDHTVALQSDGTVVAWGDNNAGQTTVPTGLSDVTYVAAGANSSAAVTRAGRVVIWGEAQFEGACCASAVAINYRYTDNQSNTIKAKVITTHQRAQQNVQTNFNAATSPTSNSITLNGLIPGRRYRYTVTISNSIGSQVYTGTFTSVQSYNRVFIPFATKSTP